MRKNRFTFNYFNMGLGRKSKGATISATSLPTLSQLYVGDTIASKYTAGSFTSTAGTISSTTTTYYQNGMAVPSNTVVVDGDEIRVANTVVDSVGNSRSFTTSTVVAIYTAPTVTVQPTITPSTDTPASVFVLDLGSATNATAAIDYFRFNDVSVVGDLSGLNYTSPTDVEGTMTLRVSYTNSGGTVYSNEVSAVSNAAPVLSADAFDDAATPPLYSFETNETGVCFWLVNGTTSAMTGEDIASAVMSETGNLFGSFTVDPGDSSFDVELAGLTSGTYGLHRTVRDDLGAYATDVVTTITVSDATAPTLTSPTDAANGSTAMTGSVSTNEAGGTLYWVVSTASTSPSAAQVKAGQMHTGSAAAASGSQAVSTTGVQNISDSGLTPATGYYTFYMHEDASANQSTVAAADGFTTTSTASYPTIAGVGTPASPAATNTVTLTLPTHQTDDILCVLISNRANDEPTTLPSGWAVGAERNTTSTDHRDCRLYWKRAASNAEANPTFVKDASNWNHIVATPFVVRGCKNTGTPFEVIGTVGPTVDAAPSCPGGTVTNNNSLIFAAVSAAIDSSSPQVTDWANSSLIDVAELFEGNTSTGTGSASAAATGKLATAGTINATTAVLPAAYSWSALTVAFIPEA